jgi:hypothetical protein
MEEVGAVVQLSRDVRWLVGVDPHFVDPDAPDDHPAQEIADSVQRVQELLGRLSEEGRCRTEHVADRSPIGDRPVSSARDESDEDEPDQGDDMDESEPKGQWVEGRWVGAT